MNSLFDFFAIQRRIFGVCPCCGQIFRLSDCRVFLKARPKKDWMRSLADTDRKIEVQEQQLAEMEFALREQARAVGRKAAQRAIRKIDSVFAPLRLHADDAKVIFHPVDYILFKGMNSAGVLRSILFLDRETNDPNRRAIQRSIENTISAGRYEWLTLRIGSDGTCAEE